MTANCQSARLRIEDLYERMHGPIYRFIHARVAQPADAEDMTSQTFLQALRWYDPERSEAEARSWLFQIARNVMGDHWRRTYRASPAVSLSEVLVATIPAVEGRPPENQSAEERSHHILSSLPGRYRQVLELRFLQGASLQETAQALDITVSNAKVLQHRALRKAAGVSGVQPMMENSPVPEVEFEDLLEAA